MLEANDTQQPPATNPCQPLKVDVGQLLRQRLPGRRIPRFAVRWLERFICQDKINWIASEIGNKQGVDAAKCALRCLGISTLVHGEGNIPPGRRFIFVSNHPLGALDGLALIAWLGAKYGNDGIKFIVNDLLTALTPLNGVFLPVNEYGSQSRQRASLIDAAYASSAQIIAFPAGLCSRLIHGRVQDTPWHKHVVTKAAQSHRDIIPIYFDARNSMCFYRTAQLRKALGIKFNFEMAMLPREMFKGSGSTFNIYVGKPVPWHSLDARHPQQQAAALRNLVYTLASNSASTHAATKHYTYSDGTNNQSN